ncbi:MAG TPA: TIM-barrel domain-containing protein, partial [Opitutaceae bacterium]|nr:TIM-barrel domain-containing protein [Opitutaceae bacterium]
LTVTGKNSASSAYQLSADKFTFTGQSPNQVAAPSFSPGGGSYGSAQSVTITTGTSGASMRYTTDGSAPTEAHGTLVSGPVSISVSTTLKAIAYETGMTDSTVTSADYIINGGSQVSAPVFSPGALTAASTQYITITSATSGATIRYTIDGSAPTETHGTVVLYEAPITSTATLKAVAYKTGMTDSDVTSATYTIKPGNGNPILPPKWAFGVMFGCYDNQTNVLSDMSQLRNGYCGDLIWVDSSWLSSNYNGPGRNYIDFTFDSGQFPDPTGMMSTLHSNHFRFGVWQWPWIDKSNPLYSTGAANHYFIENSSGTVVNGGGWHGVTYTGQFDLSTSASVVWWRHLNQPLFAMGLDFLKMDTTVGIPSGGVLANGSTSSTDWKGFYHKAAWEMTSSGQLAQGRGFILAHSDAGAATNNDQYPGLWTGDSSAVFSKGSGNQGGLSDKDMSGGFKCNTKTSGAYWCGDTGGYNKTSTDELYQRWLQYGCFTPMTEFFGAKGQVGSTGKVGRFPWCFSSTAAATFSHYTQMRYQLLPFRYSNAQACYHVTGGSVQYPVTWPTSQQIVNGQGSSEILVNPVTTASKNGTTTDVTVLFPESSSTVWLDYTPYASDSAHLLNPNMPSGQSYKGGSSTTMTVPLNEVPLFIKAGSIIPLIVNYDANGNLVRQDYVDETGFQANQLTLDIYPSGSTSYTLYEDDGMSDLYITDNEYSTTVFSSNNTSGKEMVTIGAASGSFAGQFANRTYYLRINQQSSVPAGVTRDGNTVKTPAASFADLVGASSDSWYYDSAAKIVWVKFSTPTNVSTSVSLQ